MRSVFVFFVFIAFAHTGSSQHLLIGPKAGVQATRAFYDDPRFYHDFSSKVAGTYHAGVVCNVKVTDLFSLETEILYNQTGKRLKGKDQYSLNTERYHYLTVPLLLRTSWHQGYNQFYFNTGPNLSYWLGGSGYIRIPELVEGDAEEINYTIGFGRDQPYAKDIFYVSDPNRLQLGLDVGAGALLPVRSNFLMLDLRFTWAHTNMAKKDASYMNFLFYKDNLAYANYVLSFSVAYLFEFDFFTMMTKGKSKSKK